MFGEHDDVNRQFSVLHKLFINSKPNWLHESQLPRHHGYPTRIQTAPQRFTLDDNHVEKMEDIAF